MGRQSALQAIRRAAAMPTGWIVAAALVAIMLVLAAAEDEATSLPRFVLFAVVPAVVLAVTLTRFAAQHRWVALGAVLLAVSPTAFTAAAAGLLPGAVAVVVASGVSLAVAAGAGPGSLRFGGAVAGVVAGGLVGAAGLLAISWRIIAAPSAGDPLSLPDAFGRSGNALASIAGVVARDGFPAHTSMFLLWWLGIGALSGIALLMARGRDVLVIPLAVTILGALSVTIMLRRGTFDGRYLAWVLAAAISYTGAVVSAPTGLGRRLGTAVAGVAAVTWVGGVARVSQLDDPTSMVLVARVAVTLVLLAVVAAALAATSRRHAAGRP